jgi:hypothetical protein
MRALRRALPPLWPLLLAAGGCELTEVTTAVPDDIVVAEVLLQAGRSTQAAYLHRTVSRRADSRVFDAEVIVRPEGGGEPIVLRPEADSLCLTPAPPAPQPGIGTCYVTGPRSPVVQPGQRYRLEITFGDGRRMTGSTTVPGDFRIVQPSDSVCSLEPATAIELQWTQSVGASVYIGETSMSGLRQALRAAGTPVDGGDRPVDLLALAIGAADTTMLFPGDFGVFDRLDTDLHGLLVAIRAGLPAGVDAAVAIAAADANYVNWVRGGNFNPSGPVRVPSVYGDGTGVFGSVVVRHRLLHTGASAHAPCGVQRND